MYRAKKIDENSKVFTTVRQVVSKSKLPMPEVYIIHSDNPNAFATGRNPKNAAIALTTGILKLLTKQELEGVIAHELSHIKNRDTLIATIAATIASVISYIAMMARWGALFGGYRSSDRRGQSGLELLFLAILTPIIATIIQLAISRSREYLADHKAAKTLHNSNGLSNALLKLDKYSKRFPLRFGNTATASLFIVNPFSGQSFIELFSTHPSIEKRIKKLKEMKV
jgi:heat shock protein HtpX